MATVTNISQFRASKKVLEFKQKESSYCPGVFHFRTPAKLLIEHLVRELDEISKEMDKALSEYRLRF